MSRIIIPIIVVDLNKGVKVTQQTRKCQNATHEILQTCKQLETFCRIFVHQKKDNSNTVISLEIRGMSRNINKSLLKSHLGSDKRSTKMSLFLPLFHQEHILGTLDTFALYTDLIPADDKRLRKA